MAKKPNVTPEQAREAAESLRKFWKAGWKSWQRLQRLRERDPDAYAYGNKQSVLKREADKAGYNYDTLKKGGGSTGSTPSPTSRRCVPSSNSTKPASGLRI